jgi:hypothetical protein
MGVSTAGITAGDKQEWVRAAGHVQHSSTPQRGHTFMRRAARLLCGFLVDLPHLLAREPELTIDLKRVNAEVRRAALVGLDDDIAYRERVKQRIREGSRCTHPPLIDRNKVLPFAALWANG